MLQWTIDEEADKREDSNSNTLNHQMGCYYHKVLVMLVKIWTCVRRLEENQFRASLLSPKKLLFFLHVNMPCIQCIR